LIKSSQATSHVSSGQKPNVSETFSTSIIRGMMMETEVVSKMLGLCPELTWLVAQEDFIEFRMFPTSPENLNIKII
jgi:hypothetical protein